MNVNSTYSSVIATDFSAAEPIAIGAYVIAVGYVYFQTAICSVGFILNLVNFSVFVRSTFSAPAYIMMTFLSLADATTLGLKIPLGFIFSDRLTGKPTDLALYLYVYNIYVETPITNMSENLSAWLTVALAIERYVSMCYWHIAKRYFTPTRIRKLIICLVVFIVLFNTPYFSIQHVSLAKIDGRLELYSNMTSFSQSRYYAFYSWLRILIVQIIPLGFLCLSNCLLFILVYKHNRKINQHRKLTAPIIQYNANHHGGLERNTLQMNTDHVGGPASQRNSLISIGSKMYLAPVSMYHPENTCSRISISATTTNNGAMEEHENSCYQELGTDATETKKLHDRTQKRKASQRKLTILLIAVILLFLVGQVPQSLAYLRVFTMLGVCDIDSLEHCQIHQIYRMLTVNMAHLAFASTFFLYYFLNRDFRSTLQQSFVNCK